MAKKRRIPPGRVVPAELPAQSRIARCFAEVRRDPAFRLVCGAAKGALSGAAVYIILHFVAFGLQVLSEKYPVHDDGPLAFWRTFVDWAHVIAAAVSTAIVTYFEWRDLWLARRAVGAQEGPHAA